MRDQHELEVLIKSRFPILVVETPEEARLVDVIRRIALTGNQALFQWSVATGLKRLDTLDRGAEAQTRAPGEVLQHILDSLHNALYVLVDFHPYLQDPLNVRLLKEIALSYGRTARTVVLISPRLEIPPELKSYTARFQGSVPDRAAIRLLLKEEAKGWESRNPGQRLRGNQEALENLITHLGGLLTDDVRRLARQSMDDDGMLTEADIERVIRAKQERIGLNGALSFETDTAGAADVAGLTRFKEWLSLRQKAFLGDAQAMGLDIPKGVLLLGVQGCGKSLAAKAVSGTWGVPLLRLDFGALFNLYIGETERNLREALQAADTMAPCILWVDEIEKGIGGGAAASDGGAARRVLGTLLTWMAERRSRVFMVATANDIESLPPELLRKGRFDEIFFIDLPDIAARKEILRIHLHRRQFDPRGFDLEALSRAAEGFSGSEIEQAIVAALYQAHADGSAPSTTMVQAEIERTRPLSVVMAERVTALRTWAAGRTVPAG